jgi:Zn-dependent protease/predicted transcriptional regulator
MKLSGFTLFHIAGIEIVVDYSWLVIFFMAMYTTQEIGSQVFHQQYTSHHYWIMGAVAAVLFFFSILFHELAHSLVAIRNGIRITSVRLLLFGGLAQATSEPKTGRQEFLIALAGPATSVALGMFFFMVWAFSVASIPTQANPTSLIASLLGLANVLVAVFNLIPGFPLDGGRILRAILWDHWNDMGRATKVVSQLGNAFAIFLILFGFLMFLVTQSILAGLWIVFIGLFMKQSAVGSYHGVILKRTLGGVQVKQIMTERLVTVDWLLSIEELVQNYIYRHQFTNFPVFNRDEFIGMVSLDGVKSISKDLWGFKQVRDIMTPIEFVPCLKPTDDASEALSRMVSGDIGPMPVVEDGRLLGIVSRRDIMNFFKIKSDLGAA